MIQMFKQAVATITLGAVLAFHSFAPSVQGATQGALTLIDYSGAAFTGTYGTWTGNTTTNPGFLGVNATISGGGYSSVGPFDLNSFVSNDLQLSLRQGPGATNDGSQDILLQLQDGTGHKVGYVWSMAGLPTSDQPFTTLSRQLGSPNYTAGAAGSFDFAAVNQVELLGNFSGSNVLNLEFQSVSAVPEPGTMIGGAALTLFVISHLVRRRRSGVFVTFMVGLFGAASLSTSLAGTESPVVSTDFEGSPTALISGKNTAPVEVLREEWVDGKSGKAAAFTGTAKKPGANLIYDVKGAIDDRFTVVLWAKLNEPGNAVQGGNGPERFLFRLMRSGAWGDGDVIAGFNNWGKIVFYQYENSSKFALTSSLEGGGVNDGKWHQLAFVYDAGARRIFVDGLELKYDTDAGPVEGLVGFQKIRLGALVDPASSPDGNGTGLLGGAIDQLRIYPAALSAGEIQKLASPKN